MVQRGRLNNLLSINVSRLRSEQKLTKTTFALMTGITRQTISKIERGASDVRLSYVERMADVLCVEPSDLIDDSCLDQELHIMP